MEVYEAKHDYVKERDDVLSFKKGEKFHISSKTNDKWWWAKKKDEEGVCGYVPSVYLKPSMERVIGRLVPEGRRDTEEHRIHLQALAEIHKKIKPLPAHVIGQAIGVELDSSDEEEEMRRLHVRPKQIQSIAPSKGSREEEDEDLPEYLKTMPPPPMASPPPPDYDMEDETKDRNDMPFHHKLNSSGRYSSVSSEESNDLSPTSQAGDDSLLIKSKPLPNPVKESKEHRQLHRELRVSYRRGGPLPQKSELSIVNRERKLEQRRKEEENQAKSKRSSMEVKLLERQEKERQEDEKERRLAQMKEQQAIEEEKKPEFMKVRLKQTNSVPKT